MPAPATALILEGFRWHDDGITANALMPGAIATNLQRHTGGMKTPPEKRKHGMALIGAALGPLIRSKRSALAPGAVTVPDSPLFSEGAGAGRVEAIDDH